MGCFKISWGYNTITFIFQVGLAGIFLKAIQKFLKFLAEKKPIWIYYRVRFSY